MPVMTRSVLDLARRVERARSTGWSSDAVHGGSSLYALDEDALAAAEPDLILTQELCAVCAVGYREVNEVARAIDAEITVVSLEPTLDRGHPQHDLDGRRDDRGRGRGGRARRAPARAARRDRGEGPGAARRRARRPPRVVGLEWLDPPFAVGHWVPEQIRRAGGWDLLGHGRRAGRAQTTWDAVAEVDPEMLLLMPCGYHLARDRRRVGARRRGPDWIAELTAIRRGQVYRPRRLGVLLRPGPAGRRRDRAAGRDLRPGGVRRHRRRRPAGRRSSDVASTPRARAVPRDRSTACGAGRARRRAARTTSRAGRSSARTASARPATTRSCGSGCGRRSRRGRRPSAPRRGAVAAADRAGDAGAAPPSPRPPRRPTARIAEMVAYYEARAARVRRLVPAPRPLRARPDPRRGLERRARRGRPLARRPADRAAEIVELAAGTGWWSPLLAGEGRAVAATTRRRRRSSAPASGWSPTACAPTSTSATPGPSPTGAGRRAVRRLLAEPRPARAAGDVPRARPALAQAGRPLRVHRLAARTRSRAPPTTRPPADDRRVRRLADGREFTIVKVYHEPTSSADALRAAGFADVAVTTTGRFFLLATARRGRDRRLSAPRPAAIRARRTRGCAQSRAILRADVPPRRAARSRPSAPASWPRR